DLLYVAVAQILDACGTVLLDQHAGGHGVRFDREILPPDDRMQIGPGRARTTAAAIDIDLAAGKAFLHPPVKVLRDIECRGGSSLHGWLVAQLPRVGAPAR